MGKGLRFFVLPLSPSSPACGRVEGALAGRLECGTLLSPTQSFLFLFPLAQPIFHCFFCPPFPKSLLPHPSSPMLLPSPCFAHFLNFLQKMDLKHSVNIKMTFSELVSFQSAESKELGVYFADKPLHSECWRLCVELPVCWWRTAGAAWESTK